MLYIILKAQKVIVFANQSMIEPALSSDMVYTTGTIRTNINKKS